MLMESRLCVCTPEYLHQKRCILYGMRHSIKQYEGEGEGYFNPMPNLCNSSKLLNSGSDPFLHI